MIRLRSDNSANGRAKRARLADSMIAADEGRNGKIDQHENDYIAGKTETAFPFFHGGPKGGA